MIDVFVGYAAEMLALRVLLLFITLWVWVC